MSELAQVVVRVLVVDDHHLIRAAVRQIVDAEPDLEVVGEAGDGEGAERQAMELLPDVVLMDVNMPRGDGIRTTARLSANPALAEMKVLLLTTFEQDENVLRGVRAGAAGFLGKSASAAEIAASIRAVHEGGSALSTAAQSALVRHVGGRGENAPLPGAVARLTEREREVLELVGRGADNQTVADVLGMSPATARTHVSRMLAKLQVGSRAALVIVAYESGLVVPGAGPVDESSPRGHVRRRT
ncbi:response regulator transcription factor [Nocardioides bruguierae]|uniref:response regulator transcription factor n=1 Tax=Nocardioides bruguierae TaxID=2945102 RepID=UPI00202238D4|nr:response regulator transcription factor [Nocardioides bruguierae]MCL8026898.1 response regulator transcription factor [Nocardioides bruguierae]